MIDLPTDELGFAKEREEFTQKETGLSSNINKNEPILPACGQGATAAWSQKMLTPTDLRRGLPQRSQVRPL